MKMFVQYTVAGLAGLVVLKLLGGILLPLLGLAFGLVSFVVKLLFVVLVGWLVLRLFRGRRVRST